MQSDIQDIETAEKRNSGSFVQFKMQSDIQDIETVAPARLGVGDPAFKAESDIQDIETELPGKLLVRGYSKHSPIFRT